MLLFDLDGVIRDVSASYRRAIRATVHHFCGWSPDPAAIDALKGEGCWNNDWEASLELIRRQTTSGDRDSPGHHHPTLEDVVEVFSRFYFGGDPSGPPSQWTGFICEESLLVGADFFPALSEAGIAWGFVSGAEPPSARFLLEERLGLVAPPLVAMGEAPEQPDPTGLLRLAHQLASQRGQTLGPQGPPVAYVGDTVADVATVLGARNRLPNQRFLSLAVSPPHLHPPEQRPQRRAYEERLLAAGADHLLESTVQLQHGAVALISSLLSNG
ncbi:MAG: TIGR01548 family HAD-type hydrolase [Cyanobium sp.]